MSHLPEIRITSCNAQRVRADGDYVLYWMIAARRLHWNFALDRALDRCRQLRKPLVILEALRWDFPWASDRIRRFVREGMASNAEAARGASGVVYYPYCEPAPGEGKGLLAELAKRAAIIVTDEFPCFFLPEMVAAAAKHMPVLVEQVDSNGLLPMRLAEKDFPTAYAFRRFLQKELPKHLLHFPGANPLAAGGLPKAWQLPKEILSRWPATKLECGGHDNSRSAPDGGQTSILREPQEPRGGAQAANKQLDSFLRKKLASYAEDRNDPDEDGSSGLSPYLHFGHISAHEIFSKLAKHERWKPERLALRSNGSREGWWNMSAPAEAFLDQFVTWRELGFNCCHFRKDFDKYESLPAWARKTLADHARDKRSPSYTLTQLDEAKTYDELWNAAQTQLVSEGRLHNYMRMLWGKKIIEWTRSPREALAVMIELNNRYALDGRDPNSYSGIFWCLGRYDRPWGPERPIFGTVRYMSSANTAKKLNVKVYLERYGRPAQGRLL